MSRAPKNAGASAVAPDAEDADLVRALARGDQKALAALYDRYSPLLLGLAHRILGQRREAEDLLHDVFLEAWRCAKDFDPERGSVRAWLSMRLRSRALDRVRSAGRSRVVLQDDGKLPEGTDHEQDPSAAPDRTTVRAALGKLQRDQRVVLELSYFGGHTASELAEKLNLPIGTVKSRIARGIKELRVELGEGKGGQSDE